MRENTEIAMMMGREGIEETDMTGATVEEEEVIIMKGEIEGIVTAETTDRMRGMRGMIGTTDHRVRRRRRRR